MAKSEVPELRIRSGNVKYLLSVIKDKNLPKSYKQAALKRLREVEIETGEEIMTGYNKTLDKGG